MILGIESFRQWFADYAGQYVIIGGTACDLLFSEDGLAFRATKDLDMVLIIENLTPAFGTRFWEYISIAEYEHINKSTGEPQFYRFTNPKSKDFPFMIELFSRRNDAITLPENAALTPLPLDEELSSLSAILMDDDYYQLLLDGTMLIDGIPLLDAGRLIPFKAKAWLDLSARREAGENVDSRNIKKHKNDVFRLSILLTPETRIIVPDSIHADLSDFLSAMKTESVDLEQFGIRNQDQKEILDKIAAAYIKKTSVS